MSSEALRHVWLFEGLDDDQLDALSAFTFNKSFKIPMPQLYNVGALEVWPV